MALRGIMEYIAAQLKERVDAKATTHPDHEEFVLPIPLKKLLPPNSERRFISHYNDIEDALNSALQAHGFSPAMDEMNPNIPYARVVFGEANDEAYITVVTNKPVELSENLELVGEKARKIGAAIDAGVSKGKDGWHI